MNGDYKIKMGWKNWSSWIRGGLGLLLAWVIVLAILLIYVFITGNVGSPFGGLLIIALLIFVPIISFIIGCIAGAIHKKTQIGAYVFLFAFSLLMFFSTRVGIGLSNQIKVGSFIINSIALYLSMRNFNN